MGELGQRPAHAQQHQHRAGAGSAAAPPGGGIGLKAPRQQFGLDVVEVGGRDDHVGAQLAHLSVGRADLDPAGRGAAARPSAEVRTALAPAAVVLGEDPGGSSAGVQACAVSDREPRDDVDELGEAALGVLHPAGEVQGAHQVVHARSAVRGGAEEDSRVAEHLSQAGVAETARDEAVQRLGQQAQQLRAAGEHGGVEQRPRRGERGVQEALESHVVGARGGVEIAGQAQPRPGLDPLEQVGIAGGGGAQVQRLLVPLAQDAIRRVERAQVQLLGRRGAQQAQEVVEHLGHEVPGGAGVEAEPVALPAAGAAAELFPRLDQVHFVAVPGEQRRGGQARDAAADDHGRRAGPVGRSAGSIRRRPGGGGSGW